MPAPGVGGGKPRPYAVRRTGVTLLEVADVGEAIVLLLGGRAGELVYLEDARSRYRHERPHDLGPPESAKATSVDPPSSEAVRRGSAVRMYSQAAAPDLTTGS